MTDTDIVMEGIATVTITDTIIITVTAAVRKAGADSCAR